MSPHRAIVHLLLLASTQSGVGLVCVLIELLSTSFTLPQPSGVSLVCVLIELLLLLSLVLVVSHSIVHLLHACLSCVCPHRAIIHLLQLASTQSGIATCLNPVWCWSSVCPHRAIVLLVNPANPVWCWYSVGPLIAICPPSSRSLNPVWCWSSVCPHRAVIHLHQLASTQSGVGLVCVLIKLLSTSFNLSPTSFIELLSTYSFTIPEPSLVLVLVCVLIEQLSTSFTLTQSGVGLVCVLIELLSISFNPA